jgi:hypothetical protein
MNVTSNVQVPAPFESMNEVLSPVSGPVVV